MKNESEIIDQIFPRWYGEGKMESGCLFFLSYAESRRYDFNILLMAQNEKSTYQVKSMASIHAHGYKSCEPYNLIYEFISRNVEGKRNIKAQHTITQMLDDT
ncbi:hypothetical protein AVEN_168528-1 [Araneus ventricosus]|uniref:Uncharacterized protein n=1 Tax=Araneus ventricosus TaxID=182803 RepID=A0A4Y2LBS4_ARAVE|nr:hypothetical protein AVEN_168528-1 [Araneus ventricosus]